VGGFARVMMLAVMAGLVRPDVATGLK